MSLIHPVKKVYITQKWGVNADIYKRFGLSGHNGVDYRIFSEAGNRAVYGRSFAPHDGKIIEAYNDGAGYGWYVKIENDKEGSILAHHKELMVRVGDVVKQGDLIGITDNTGWSTGPHLHWGYYLKPRNKANGYSGTINQLLLIGDNMPDTIPVKKKTFEELVNKSTKYDKFKEMGYDEPSKIKEDIEKCAKNLKESKKLAKDTQGLLETCENSKAQMISRKDYNLLKAELTSAQEVAEVTPTDEKFVKLILYLGLSGGLGYLTSVYVMNDPALTVAFMPVINIVLYILEQKIGVLKKVVGLGRSK